MEGILFLKFTSFDFCDIGHIQLDVPHQIWEAISLDGNANIWITRFFHNTPLFYANNLLRCYLSYFSPDFINQQFTLIGLLGFILGIGSIVSKKQWKVMVMFLIMPLFPIFDFPSDIFGQSVVVYGVIFLIIILGIKEFLILLSRNVRSELKEGILGFFRNIKRS